jgi:hypothetical protein
MNTEIDNFPVSELQNRFSLGKQAVYNRLDALGIKPFKEGNRSYITADQLQLLDQLHEHINQGGTMAEFKKSAASPVDKSESPADKQISPVDKSESPVEIVETGMNHYTANNLEVLVQVVSTGVEKAIATSTQAKSPLWYMVELKRATDEGWLLTTKEVKDLIGVKPKTKKGENTYKRGNWLFIKSGKIGNQTAWKVTKEEK